MPLYRLKSYIDNNTPVMIWATICMEPPIESDIWTVPETGREITWVYPMHALVLMGYDENGYPLAGQDIYYGKDSVEVARLHRPFRAGHHPDKLNTSDLLPPHTKIPAQAFNEQRCAGICGL